MKRRVMITIFLSVLLAIVLSIAYVWYTIDEVLAQEHLPHDFLTQGDSFKLIIDINDQGVSSVTYHYEFVE